MQEKNLKEKILELLNNTQDYISGQKLCELLGVSRTAVWKNIRQLQDEGYVIDAVNNKGYKITAAGDILSEYELKKCFNTRWIGSRIYYFDELDSTNMEAKRLADDNCPEGTFVSTDCQVSGRGRLGRVWSSPHGEGLFMSFILRPDYEILQASMVTLVAAMAVRKGINEMYGIDTMIKWPNDVVVSGKKICGILTEMSMEEDHIRYIIPGIGVNVNNESFPDELKEKAVSVYLITGKKEKRALLADAICRAFEDYYDNFKEHGNLSGLKDEYNQSLINIGKEVVISSPSGTCNCISKGIDESGALNVVHLDGSVEKITSGEVSVRGVYGYV